MIISILEFVLMSGSYVSAVFLLAYVIGILYKVVHL